MVKIEERPLRNSRLNHKLRLPSYTRLAKFDLGGGVNPERVTWGASLDQLFHRLGGKTGDLH